MKAILNLLIFFATLFLLGCSKGDSGGGSTSPTTTIPVSPSGLSATVVSSTQINLSWSDNSSNETGFTIERKTATGAYSPITTTSANTTTYNDLSLQPGTSYTYRVNAYNSAGNSATYSNEVTTITAAGPIVLSTYSITGLTSTGAASGGFITSDGGATVTARGVVWSTSPNPTVALPTKTNDGTGTGNFNSNVTGLTAGTSYYLRAYATNSGGTYYGSQVTFTTLGADISDIDGNVYPTILQCTQTWMAKNLTVSHYRNGDPIPQVSDPALWASSATGAWCYVNNDPITEAVYGKLYNWPAVNDPRGIAPAGWHVASLFDYNKIVKCIDPTADTTFIGTTSYTAGGAMKETGFAHWQSPNTGATNNTYFSGVPAGIRSNSPAAYYYFGQLAGFWTSTQQNPYNSYSFSLYYAAAQPATNTSPPNTGLSVRCVKD